MTLPIEEARENAT